MPWYALCVVLKARSMQAFLLTHAPCLPLQPHQRFGKSLLSLGLQRFQSVNIMGFNSPGWVVFVFVLSVSQLQLTRSSPPPCEQSG